MKLSKKKDNDRLRRDANEELYTSRKKFHQVSHVRVREFKLFLCYYLKVKHRIPNQMFCVIKLHFFTKNIV